MATQIDLIEAERESQLGEETRKGQSLWVDSYRRLVSNRAAVIGAVLVIILVLMAIFAPLIAPKSFSEQVLTDNNKVPAWMLSVFPSMKGYVQIGSGYILGADYVGRDLLSRIIYGARVSLAVAFVGPIISMLVASPMAVSPASSAAGWITL